MSVSKTIEVTGGGSILLRFFRPSRFVKRAAAVIVGVPLCYAALLAFPEPFFRYHIDCGRFSVYSTRPIDPAIRPVLVRAEQLLSRSEIDDRGIHQRIFLCNSPSLFATFSANMPWATARDYLFADAFIANCDIRRDQAWNTASLPWDRKCGIGRTRRLSGTIAHETTHTLAYRKRGVLASIFGPGIRWKEEGYADYIAQESPVDVDAAAGRLIDGNVDGCLQYFDDRMMVAYLLRDRGLTYDQLTAYPPKPVPVLMATKAWLRSAQADGKMGPALWTPPPSRSDSAPVTR